MPAYTPTVPLHFTESGPKTGRPVVLLHGFPFDGSMWTETAAELSGLGYRVIVPDLRGHGKSPVASPATMEAMARDVDALMEANSIPKAAVVGFSMGGYVALQMVIRHLDRVRAVALVDTRAEGDSPEGKANREKTVAAVKDRGMTALVESMLPKLTHPSSPDVVRDRLKAMMVAQNPEGAMNAVIGMRDRPDVRPRLHFLKIPALVVVGEEDQVTPVEAAHTLAQGLPGSEIEVVAKAGHAVPLEQPKEFHRILVEWLRKV